MNYGFGVDVGGTTIKLGFFDIKGSMIDKWEIPTNTSGQGKYILAEIAESIGKYIKEKGVNKADVLGIGLGVPGPVDQSGTLYKCVNLGWGVFNPAKVLEELTGLHVKAGNDANMAALGEMWQGGGSGYENLVMVTLGTGVGGGIVLGGRAVSGVHGAGGEVGHIPIKHPENRVCGCGNVNCLEVYASGSGFARTAKKRLGECAGESSLRGVSEVSAKEIFQHAANGDALSIELVEELGMILGEALAAVSCVCDPDIFVIGGGVSNAGQPLLDVIQKHFKEAAFHACVDTKFALATLGGDAGKYGAMRLLL